MDETKSEFHKNEQMDIPGEIPVTTKYFISIILDWNINKSILNYISNCLCLFSNDYMAGTTQSSHKQKSAHRINKTPIRL